MRQKYVTSGVPQGFVLDPFLFGIYFCDIKAAIKGLWLTKFVDNCRLKQLSNHILILRFSSKGWTKQILGLLIIGLPSSPKMQVSIPWSTSINTADHTDKIPLRFNTVIMDFGTHVNNRLSFDPYISVMARKSFYLA